MFKLVKFRTMTNAKDENGELLSDAERLTKYGKFLRNTSLDELPELFNILKGDMSVIGPRPLLVQYLPYYTEEERHRHDVRPGLSGLAQANGRNNVTWEEKFAWDIKYVNEMSLIL
ncbi:sugar transferase, partial [Eubacterium sp.]|uniref:sugar transferase n=1 Tax=Eubacterium sp. TaxID=142586 RepID=UPI0034573FE8